MIYNHTLSGYQKRFQAFLDVVKIVSAVNALLFSLIAFMSILQGNRIGVYYIALAFISIHLPGMIVNRFRKLFFFCILFTSAAIVLVFSNIETLRELPVKVDSLRFLNTILNFGE